MSRTIFLIAALGAAVIVRCPTAQAINLSTVPVDNANNPSSSHPTRMGAVDHAYRIGTFEVTNSQYAAFLNAKAVSDPLGLYNGFMGSTTYGGITRNGGSGGGFAYAVKPGKGDWPVNFVSWYDAARFVNWLNNGQGSSDTETGAYTLLGGTPIPSNALSITRNAGATWFLPSEDEWYKAAYYNPSTSSYYEYPTSSNTPPVAEAPPGGPNSANYETVLLLPTPVGAYGGSVSPSGTYDQAGNVWEWNETLLQDMYRGILGGSFLGSTEAAIGANNRGAGNPEVESEQDIGFRVATIPEPSSLALAALGLLAVCIACAKARERRPAHA